MVRLFQDLTIGLPWVSRPGETKKYLQGFTGHLRWMVTGKGSSHIPSDQTTIPSVPVTQSLRRRL